MVRAKRKLRATTLATPQFVADLVREQGAEAKGKRAMIACRAARDVDRVIGRSGGIGRRARLKIVWANARVGSTPTFGTKPPKT